MTSVALRTSLFGRVVAPPNRTNVKLVRNSRIGGRYRFQTKSAMLPQNSRMVVAEKLNGRLAMLGYLAGSGYENVTGMNYIDQIHRTYPFVIAISLVIGFATLKTRDIKEDAPFTTTLEMLNGCMAMMGVFAKLIYDSGVLNI